MTQSKWSEHSEDLNSKRQLKYFLYFFVFNRLLTTPWVYIYIITTGGSRATHDSQDSASLFGNRFIPSFSLLNNLSNFVQVSFKCMPCKILLHSLRFLYSSQVTYGAKFSKCTRPKFVYLQSFWIFFLSRMVLSRERTKRGLNLLVIFYLFEAVLLLNVYFSEK